VRDEREVKVLWHDHRGSLDFGTRTLSTAFAFNSGRGQQDTVACRAAQIMV